MLISLHLTEGYISKEVDEPWLPVVYIRTYIPIYIICSNFSLVRTVLTTRIQSVRMFCSEKWIWEKVKQKDLIFDKRNSCSKSKTVLTLE